MAMAVIAADVGGSKTLLGWFPAPGAPQFTQFFDNHQQNGLESLLLVFLKTMPMIDPANITLVVAIAGPVQACRQCQMTNLPWFIDVDTLRLRFGFARVVLLNDLEATAWAMPRIATHSHLQSLNGLTVQFQQPVAVLSIGTGLGEALLLPDNGAGMRVLASEGGHKQFAPFDLHSASLLQTAFSAGKTSLSWEEWFSGAGLPNLFHALFPQDLPQDSAEMITRQALDQPLSHAAHCMAIFGKGLFAEAGNIALQYWSQGGVIFAGGVTQHIRTWLEQAELQTCFHQKSRHTEWLKTVPLALCTDTHAALQGAADVGWHQQIRGN